MTGGGGKHLADMVEPSGCSVHALLQMPQRLGVVGHVDRGPLGRQTLHGTA
ncbi:hypothetical protein [Sphingomonas sp. Leaf242]|uniref:hypothetical protein n=1 Tax=Sphingomonas sp. Leaf242 TaxID=1736304 RepID=UPI001F364EED|nr:hypothetical protein [Sphingomonas sp. Leaf242]